MTPRWPPCFCCARASVAPILTRLMSWVHSFAELLGESDGWSLMLPCSRPRRRIFADRRVKTFIQGHDLLTNECRTHPQQINDQAAARRDDTMRIWPSFRTPDAMLFQTILTPGGPLPSGLTIAAALGSAPARSILSDPQLLTSIDNSKSFFDGASLYQQYMQVLATLAHDPDKDAPPLFSTPAWKLKSCQTILTGWALSRHTWQLQAKQNVMLFEDVPGVAGFVEPSPDFYAKMADLLEHTQALLREDGAFKDPLDIVVYSPAIRALADRAGSKQKIPPTPRSCFSR